MCLSPRHTLLGESGRINTPNMLGGGCFLRLRPWLAKTTLSSGHAAPFNLGSKHGRCGDNWGHVVITYDDSAYNVMLSATNVPNHGRLYSSLQKPHLEFWKLYLGSFNKNRPLVADLTTAWSPASAESEDFGYFLANLSRFCFCGRGATLFVI